MWTKAGQAYDHGTALACDLKIKPSADETARVRLRAGREQQLVLVVWPGWEGEQQGDCAG